MGFAIIISTYLFGTMEMGKIIGDAYMSKRIPKLIRYFKSLYFTVRAEKNKPKPNPSNPIMIINKGKYKIMCGLRPI
tara:strand:+ start:229 stop:459 length:231 start_codon:yes stop_codon:yes gene_type:complete